MIEEQIIKLIGDYGIQAAMLVWFMFRTEKVIDNNSQQLIKINEVITKCQRK